MGILAHNGSSILAQVACIWEATARKVGNVHPGASFKDVEFTDFLISGAVLGDALRMFRRKAGGPTLVGEYVFWSEASGWVGSNTNLGIALLLAPLVDSDPTWDYRRSVAEELGALRRSDTVRVYQAIRSANPGGLGVAPEQDVRAEPTATLLEAMRLAADRDMVARQYANGFADVFDFGVPAFLAGLERFGCVEAAIVDSQLRWLAEYPDSLIARKRGAEVAADVQKRAAEVLRRGGLATPEGRRAGVALDTHLRSDGNKLNPGTTADLITACLFVALRENKVAPNAPFRWHVTDWL
ncbi:triphosphoribosyl-dephospho-CoA synthase [Gemmata sp.]|uniref:triphosphoribosyl-dephospho-CoA synthase n=1 Tax=Gemmata sp. TaxID=1914242 RepID=UPI003F728311